MGLLELTVSILRHQDGKEVSIVGIFFNRELKTRRIYVTEKSSSFALGKWLSEHGVRHAQIIADVPVEIGYPPELAQGRVVICAAKRWSIFWEIYHFYILFINIGEKKIDEYEEEEEEEEEED